MITASELSGLFTAHAVWCIADDDPLIPILAYVHADCDERQMERLALDDTAAAVEFGQQKLAANEMQANEAALIYEGWITLNEERLSALIIELRTYFSPASKAVIAIPYTPKSEGKFRVHMPKVLVWENCDDFDLNAAMEAFFRGVSEHEEGSAVWNDALDDSK